MKHFFIRSLIILFAFSVGAIDYPTAPEKDYYSTSLWRERDVITVPPEGVELTQDTVIRVDQLVLNGPLYSNGYQLKIDAIKITFNEGGAIRGFKSAAPAGKQRAEGAPGTNSTSTSGTGGNGLTPEEADQGVDGHQSPSSIVIYASRFEGKVIIDGTGQSGGRGGHGGKGGRGGQGGPGRKASASCSDWVFGDGSGATNGGRGGQGAPGGKGGKGGRGGRAIPLVVVSGTDLPQDAELISQPGSPGKGGEAGLPGDRGPGGRGGYGDSKGCGTWPIEWTARRSGGNPGPKGPGQTETMGPGVEGESAPDIDLNVEPLPRLASLQRGPQKGILIGNFSDLEDLRSELAVAWSQFHWARSFLFLTLDTLIEIQTQRERMQSEVNHLIEEEIQDDFLSRLLMNTSNERLESLISLWKANFVEPTKEIKMEWVSPLVGARKVAIEVVELLEMIRDRSQGSEKLLFQLERVRSGARSQLEGALISALEACMAYNDLKIKQIPEVLSLTGYYSVPVCEGFPDMRKAENIDKPIHLFSRYSPRVGSDLAPFHQRVARRSHRSLFPQAVAEGFSVVVVDNQEPTPDQVQSRTPNRGVWLEAGLGLLVGHPGITRATSVADIGQRLFFLQNAFKRIRER